MSNAQQSLFIGLSNHSSTLDIEFQYFPWRHEQSIGLPIIVSRSGELTDSWQLKSMELILSHNYTFLGQLTDLIKHLILQLGIPLLSANSGQIAGIALKNGVDLQARDPNPYIKEKERPSRVYEFGEEYSNERMNQRDIRQEVKFRAIGQGQLFSPIQYSGILICWLEDRQLQSFSRRAVVGLP